MDPIKVTVVISPGANTRDTLNSLLAQTCREIEILCHPCADLPGDSRIRILELATGKLYKLPEELVEDLGNGGIGLRNIPLTDTPLAIIFG